MLCIAEKKEEEKEHTHGACSSMALAGFALPECPGSSSRVYPALEGLAAVVHRGLVPPPSRVRPSMCTPVTPAVPYLLLGLQDVQWAVGTSRGARKLARTPHVNQKKKYISLKYIIISDYCGYDFPFIWKFYIFRFERLDNLNKCSGICLHIYVIWEEKILDENGWIYI